MPVSRRKPEIGSPEWVAQQKQLGQIMVTLGKITKEDLTSKEKIWNDQVERYRENPTSNNKPFTFRAFWYVQSGGMSEKLQADFSLAEKVQEQFNKDYRYHTLTPEAFDKTVQDIAEKLSGPKTTETLPSEKPEFPSRRDDADSRSYNPEFLLTESSKIIPEKETDDKQPPPEPQSFG